MMARRGATGLSGMLVIDKPGGMTSHDVVARLRRATGERRIGHAGTLDPLATGILLVLVGSATRLERYLSGHDKSYRALISFGSETDTLDADGAVSTVHPIPDAVLDATEAQRILDGFLGPGSQIPPVYSAIKRDGVPAHRLARAGTDVEMLPRDIVVHEAVLEGIDASNATWDVRFAVSKGTYIRSLARDIGVAAGSGAHLAALRRTAVDAITIERARALDEVCVAAAAGELVSLFVDPVPALGFPVIEGDAVTVRAGRALPAPAVGLPLSDDRVSVIVEGRLGAVYRAAPDGYAPETVFIPEVAR
ncbi:MAG: tRNA pseudouridine(55) synthase TruB [Coriobacteriia bacterium]|nr:tRNA pseudouridine(55) synthase TruB [Coriobacteriia bacterium]MBN2840041.1 tRNA pseudouridine(55) synthase TruB [Coriobacteriia bacterium]